MDQRTKSLISGYLDETLTAGEFVELENWINSDPDHTKQFARIIQLENRIQAEVNAEKYLAGSPPSIVPSSDWNIRWIAFGAMAAAVFVILVTSIWNLQDPEVIVRRETSIATVAQLVDAVFLDRSYDQGDELVADDRVILESGFARLLFADGVEVTVEGPAEYKLVSQGNSQLKSGLLTATVPIGSEGFRVSTPAGEVVDRGTAFGVEADSLGDCTVSVFDGEVEVSAKNENETELVAEGEAVRISDDKVRRLNFDAAPFEKIWPVSSGIVGSTGDFRFAPQWPRLLKRVESDTDIFVLPEGYAVTLKDEIAVDISKPGNYKSKTELTPGSIESGRRVKSYLLQFNPVSATKNSSGRPFGGPGKNRAAQRGPKNRDGIKRPPRSIQRIVGQITFDQPVLGLIVLGDQLHATDGLFSNRAGRGPQMGRSLELEGMRISDRVSLSEDRRTVELDLAAIGKLSDHVRVIVDRPLPGTTIDAMPAADR